MATQGLNLSLRTNATPQQLLKELLLSPLIYIRLGGILCSIIVFGCVADQVAAAPGLISGIPVVTCGYNASGACSFAIAIGVIGFLLCLVFLVKDVVYVIVDYSENIVVKKVILLVDAVTNGIWAFMWFVCFCYTADQMRNNRLTLTGGALGCANAGIAFSFFCILLWIAIVVVNIIYFILIIRSSRTEGSGYTSFPEGPTDQPYQGSEGETQPQYTPPEY